MAKFKVGNYITANDQWGGDRTVYMVAYVGPKRYMLYPNKGTASVELSRFYVEGLFVFAVNYEKTVTVNKEVKEWLK